MQADSQAHLDSAHAIPLAEWLRGSLSSTPVSENFRLIRKNADGSALFEAAVAVDTPTLNKSKTAGGGDEKSSLTTDALQEMVDNFALWKRPVPVGFGPHVDFNKRAEEGEAFVRGLKVVGEKLMALIDVVIPERAQQLIRRQWQAFSIEFFKDIVFTTRKFLGHLLVGGTFTNRPALEIDYAFSGQFEGAALGVATTPMDSPSSAGADAHVNRLDASPGIGGRDMSTDNMISLATHEATVGKLQAALGAKDKELESFGVQLTALRDDLARMRNENSALAAADLDKSRQLQANKVLMDRDAAALATQTRVNEALQEKLTALEASKLANETEQLNKEVHAFALEAIAAGVPPAMFDGHEADPATWLRANYASLDAMKKTLAPLKGIVKLAGKVGDSTKSGHKPGTDEVDDSDKKDPSALAVTDEDKERFGRMKAGDGEFVNVTDAASAEKVHKAQLAAKGSKN